jgi:hypothetical protein
VCAAIAAALARLRNSPRTTAGDAESQCAIYTDHSPPFTVDAPPVATEAVKAAIGARAARRREGSWRTTAARFTARLQGRPTTSAAGIVELAIEPSQVRLFSSESGRTIELGERLVQAV